MGGKVGVVIVTYNSAKYVKGCLGSLERQSYPEFETVVVDNGSTDGTLDELGAFDVHVIPNSENLGFAAANNIGAAFAAENLGCDYILLLNPDIEADGRLIEELVQTLVSSGEISVVQGKLFMMGERDLLNTAGNRLHYLYFGYCEGYMRKDSYAGDREISYTSGACMMFCRGLMEKLGYLFAEEFFMYHEDTDFCLRARLIGGKSVLSARAVAWHDYRFSAAGSKFYHMEKNRLFLMLQNYRAGTLAMLAPVVIFTELQVLLFSVLKRWLPWKLKSYLWLMANIKTVMSRRRAVQETRTVDDLELMGCLVTDISFDEVDNPGLKYITNPVLKYYYRFVTEVIGWSNRLRGSLARPRN